MSKCLSSIYIFNVSLTIYFYVVLSDSVSKSSMYQLLQPRLDVLLFEVIFPLMCFNDNDQRLWDEDPHEYVRKGYGELYPLLAGLHGSFLFISGYDTDGYVPFVVYQILLRIYTVQGLLQWTL